MADNVSITAGTGTSVATDNIGGVNYQRIKLDNGADGVSGGDVCATNPLAVSSSPKITSGATLTRPADTTAYAVGDLVANSTTAASVAAILFTSCARGTDVGGRVTGASLAKSGTGTTNATYRLHLFKVNPVASAPTNGDNGAFAPALKAGYLGFIDFPTPSFAFGDGVGYKGILSTSSFINFAPVSGTANLYGLVEARGAYTPANAETFIFSLEVE